jgi:16S rRNA (uracil1498-N3)-methyltransferase
MTRQIRVPLSPLVAGERRIAGAEAHYLARVLRLRPGATFVAFDPLARNEARVTVTDVERDYVLAHFEAPEAAQNLGHAAVTLIQCAGKGDKVDDVVRAATALGASRVVVATSEHSVARGPSSPERRQRLATIALDAARQSGRGDVPELAGPVALVDAIAELRGEDAQKLCLEPGAERTFGAALRERGERALVLLVGPEGGFSDGELELARGAGFGLVRLGGLVLRTELAAVAALAAVLGQD